MSLNKEIITQLIITVVVVIMFFAIVGPAIYEFLKNKIPGAYQPENDIDSMIRRQKDRLRAQYGLKPTTQEKSFEEVENTPISRTVSTSQEVKQIFKESKWGGSQFTKKIQDEITKNYSYTLAESKINAFILLSEKRNYISYLSSNNQKSLDAIANYLSILMLLLIVIEEIRDKNLNLVEKMAKKCKVPTEQLLLALQIKILQALKSKKEIKDDKIYLTTPTLLTYSEESLQIAVNVLLSKEANFWARGHSAFFEELALQISYADFLVPLPKIKNKTDVETARDIFKIKPETEIDEIKNIYKRQAMILHPDKIGQLNLPTILERKALAKFSTIQEAYDILLAERKK